VVLFTPTVPGAVPGFTEGAVTAKSKATSEAGNSAAADRA